MIAETPSGLVCSACSRVLEACKHMEYVKYEFTATTVEQKIRLERLFKVLRTIGHANDLGVTVTREVRQSQARNDYTTG